VRAAVFALTSNSPFKGGQRGEPLVELVDICVCATFQW
jgi:hypothetical protein